MPGVHRVDRAVDALARSDVDRLRVGQSAELGRHERCRRRIAVGHDDAVAGARGGRAQRAAQQSGATCDNDEFLVSHHGWIPPRAPAERA
jgi:hypothetical protein